jgi:uncharacterized protein YodC (DUF2158 family)
MLSLEIKHRTNSLSEMNAQDVPVAIRKMYLLARLIDSREPVKDEPGRPEPSEEKKSPAFKLGDVVQLKSGGPSMTVTTAREKDQVGCHWFSEHGDIKWFNFHPDALTHVAKPESSAFPGMTCSSEHQVLTYNRGWVAFKDLTKADEVVPMAACPRVPR